MFMHHNSIPERKMKHTQLKNGHSTRKPASKPTARLAPESNMKVERHNAIRKLITRTSVTSQDDLRRRLAREGFDVTQATLSRDVNELRLVKGREGYSISKAGGLDEELPTIQELFESFGLSVHRALNQMIIRTTLGSAQPVAAAIDRENWSEVLGTIAGDDTIFVICPDARRAHTLQERLDRMLQS
jgi:transcriptional regulator of arginine metabolism